MGTMMTCNDAPMVFECWETVDGTEITFGPVGVGALSEFDRVRGFAPRYSVRASSWPEAMQAHHDIQGWEPYKPY